MPLRRKLKKAREYLQNVFTSPVNTRPSTPTGASFHSSPLETGSQQLEPTVHRKPSNSILRLSLPGTTPEIDSVGAIKQETPNVKCSNLSAPGVGTHILSAGQPAPADESTLRSHATEHIGAGVVPEMDQPRDTESLKVPQTSQVTVDGTSMGWQSLKRFTKVLAPVTNMFGPVKEMADMFVECVDECKIAEEAQVEYNALRVQLERLFEDLQRYFGEGCQPTMTSSMECLCKSIKTELGYIKQKRERSKRERYMMAADEASDILASYRRIEGHLQRFSLNANISMWRIVQDRSTASDVARMSSSIERLPPSSSAWYNSAEGAELKRRDCTPGTRVDVLANMLGWARSSTGSGVYWLNGMAGTGKTTIAYSLCTELDAARQLGASFFCSRLREEGRNVNLIIPSIAYQLARFSRPFQSALSSVLEKDPDAHRRLPHMQFDALISGPVLEVQAALPEQLVVVIDALDECEQKESTSHMLDVLLSKSASLPIKFIVSSRPEPQIRDQMTEERTKSRLVLHELEKGEVQADIEKYLREGLALMRPSDEHIRALSERAGVLFIYAATAVRYIGFDNFQSDPEDRLRTILNGSQCEEDGETEEIDELYMTILEAALGNPRLRKVERDTMRQILYTVVCARGPLTITGLSKLLQVNNVVRVRAVLRPLWSVLHVVETNELVTTLHASFPDFMLDPNRSKAHHCDLAAHNYLMAEMCFECIAQTEPQFNICGLDSSYLPDENVADIEERVANAISSELFYACRFWVDHVNAAHCASGVVEQMRDFLSTRLLLWMEVLNLKNQMKAGIGCMEPVVKWCKELEGEQELAELAQDAKRFVEGFASNPVSQSTPHIYVSMMACWPRSAPISNYYAMFTRGPVEAEGTAPDRRQLTHLSTWAFEKSIWAAIFSQDGQYVALAISREVLVVESSSGKAVLGPLQGHPDRITAVVFSPDGLRILAGSFGNRHATILGWDTRSGDAVLGPLQLREDETFGCLSFSPDCCLIATGHAGRTACLWHAQTGEMLLKLEPLGVVTVVVFSPDSTRVATGSMIGGSLQVWDSQTGDTITDRVTHLGRIDLIALSTDNTRIICVDYGRKVARVLDAIGDGTKLQQIALHPLPTTSIGFSPDGRHVVSGSSDGAVRIWEPESARMVLGPLEAHTGSVNSVTFSPNGSRIISACGGGLVCTWDVQQHTITPSSTTIPSHRITCVKFSSDGARFVSGSEEGSICIWNACTGEVEIGPVSMHTDRINAVDFKNNSIVSCSGDGKMCVCDTRTGAVVLGQFEIGHSRITTVAYSPTGTLIATGSNYGVELWSAQDGSRVLGPLRNYPDMSVIESLQFSPDGSRIVAGAETSAHTTYISVWDLSDGRDVFGVFETLNRDERPGCPIAYSPDGTLIASRCNLSEILLWDAFTGQAVNRPFIGHSGFINSLSFSPDSTRLVSGSGDRTIWIWDVQTGQMLFEVLHGHGNRIISAEFSPDGTRILSYSADTSVRINDARSPEEWSRMCSEYDIGDWKMVKDGWVVDDESRLLAWVPGDLRKRLMWPRTQVVIPQGYLRLKLDKSRLGKSWAQFYTSSF